MNAQIITKKKNTLKRDLLSWIIGIPSIILFVFFIWGPLFQNIIYSFFKTSNFDMVSFNGFGNYIAIIKDPRFIGALRNTVLYVIYSLSVSPCRYPGLGNLRSGKRNRNFYILISFRRCRYLDVEDYDGRE